MASAPIDGLPVELLPMIASYVDHKTRLNLVCKDWKQLKGTYYIEPFPVRLVVDGRFIQTESTRHVPAVGSWYSIDAVT